MNRFRLLSLEIARYLVCAGLVAVLSSCKFLFPAVTHGAGHSSKPKVGWPAGRVRKDQRVTLYMANDSVIVGRLKGVRPIEGAAYREWHERTFPGWAERWGLCLKPGEPAELLLRTGDRLRGTLAEVDQHSVTVTVEGNDRRFWMEKWERVDTGGDCTTKSEELTLIREKEWLLPPLLLAIRNREGETAEIRSDAVARTLVRGASKRSLRRALGVGLLCDRVVAGVLGEYYDLVWAQ